MHSLQHIKRNNDIAAKANGKLYDEVSGIVGSKLLEFTRSVVEIQNELYSSIKTLSDDNRFSENSIEDPLAEKAREQLNKFFKEVLWGNVRTGIDNVYNSLWLANRDKTVVSKPDWTKKHILDNLESININVESYIKDLEDIVDELIENGYCEQQFSGGDNSNSFIGCVKNIRSSALEIECQRKIIESKLANSIILWKLLNFR